jgi:hypothetical protein
VGNIPCSFLRRNEQKGSFQAIQAYLYTSGLLWHNLFLRAGQNLIFFFAKPQMKTIFLTLFSIALGSSIAFGQTSPKEEPAAEEGVYTLTLDRMSAPVEAASRRTISALALPEMIVEQLKYSPLAGHTILGATEILPPFGEEEDLQYELLLQEPQPGTGKPAVLLVRYDFFGKLISQKEAPKADAAAVETATEQK